MGHKHVHSPMDMFIGVALVCQAFAVPPDTQNRTPGERRPQVRGYGIANPLCTGSVDRSGGTPRKMVNST
jgi:hypothetical protein